jgi:hypothetical protein
VAKDEVVAYAYLLLSGAASASQLRGDGDLSDVFLALKKKMSPEARLRGQLRTKELQKEIEAKIAAKKAEDEKNSGK